MEESVIHETNFRESMKMLVISDTVKHDDSLAKEDKQPDSQPLPIKDIKNRRNSKSPNSRPI